jgi:hypothetical protein
MLCLEGVELSLHVVVADFELLFLLHVGLLVFKELIDRSLPFDFLLLEALLEGDDLLEEPIDASLV